MMKHELHRYVQSFFGWLGLCFALSLLYSLVFLRHWDCYHVCRMATQSTWSTQEDPSGRKLYLRCARLCEWS
jgi:hypothetical protein